MTPPNRAADGLPLASVSLDADNLWSYKRTHGDADWVDRQSYLPALRRRMVEVFDAHRIQPSVMVVGADAVGPDGAEFITAMAEYGCEIGNHSFEHEPWLHLYTRPQLSDEIRRTEEAIMAAGAAKPRGFRAPGFATSPDLMTILDELDYDYDCSVLATWIGPLARLYYLRTNTDLDPTEREQRKALFGAASDALLPNRPFAWTARDQASVVELTEIPVTVFPILRVPMHASYVIYLSGFSMVAAKAYVRLALAVCRATRTEPSLLLHPLDLLDAADAPGLEFFPGMQLDHGRKMAVLSDLLEQLGNHHRLVGMAEHAAAHATRSGTRRPIGLLSRGRS
jgi:peptidoglycan-N-acetylglucosamine deacetylase